MPKATVRANARGFSETQHPYAAAATDRRTVSAPAFADEGIEILTLRAEFERLDGMRRPVENYVNELSATFESIALEKGVEAAKAWGAQANLDDLIQARDKLDSRASRIIERMIALKPKTPRGITAVAETLKEDHLASDWKEPEEDRDYDVPSSRDSWMASLRSDVRKTRRSLRGGPLAVR